MRKLSLGLALVAMMMLAVSVRAADDQNTSAAGGASASASGGSSASGQDLDKIFIENAGVHGMFEQKLSEAAQQQASDSKVKQFAEKMVQDHTQANQKLQEVAQKIGATVPQQLPEMKQKELDAIKAQQGKDFDQAYLSCMKAMHLADVSSFGDKAQVAKNQDVKQFASQQLPTLRQHERHVIALASAQGLPNPMGDAQTAGARMHGDSDRSDKSSDSKSGDSKSGESPDSGHRGTHSGSDSSQSK